MSLTPPHPTPTCPECESSSGVRRVTDPFWNASHRCGPCGANFTKTPKPERVRKDAFETEPARSDNEIIPYLRENGPSPRGALPVETVQGYQRQRYGIRRVAVNNGALNRAESVWYLPEHDPQDVLRVYIDANPRVLSRDPRTVASDLKGHDDALREAWRELVNAAGGAWG